MDEINGFPIDQYNIHGIKQGATAWTCPKCSAGRSTADHRKQKCMTVNWKAGIGHCNHCGEKVQLHTFKAKPKEKTFKVPMPRPVTAKVTDSLGEYSLKQRGVSRTSLDALHVVTGKRFMPKAQKEIEVVEFPYFVNGTLVNVKYRGKNKDFSFEPGCEVVLFNLDNIMHESECIIVEGEWDALSYVEAGFMNVASVPNGFTLPRSDGSSSINLSYLDDYWRFIQNKERVYLAVDNDEAGNHGKQELIRRIGSDKCWTVNFKDCKDANEYLVKYGKEALAKTIEEAVQIPMENVVTLNDYRADLESFYINGIQKGWLTGMPALDDNYSIEPGQYCIVTGAPQSGKSEFVDSICIGYALKYGYKTCFASPENKPNFLHGAKLVEKVGGYQPNNEEQVKSKRIREAFDFCADNFYHIEYNGGYELSGIIAKFTELVRRKGVRCFVIDPFNKVRLKASHSKHINEYTSDYLQEIDNFCRSTNSVVYLVAHPTKLQKVPGTNSYPMVSPYDIKGGGEMFDMAYHILGIRRNMEQNLVEVKTLKIKFRHLGRFEEYSYFKFNLNNGRYVSTEDPTEGKALPPIVWDNESWVSSEPPKETVMHIQFTKPPELEYDVLQPTEEADF